VLVRLGRFYGVCSDLTIIGLFRRPICFGKSTVSTIMSSAGHVAKKTVSMHGQFKISNYYAYVL
jgi:hypothetical protein